jgi:hypothetical protein
MLGTKNAVGDEGASVGASFPPGYLNTGAADTPRWATPLVWRFHSSSVYHVLEHLKVDVGNNQK